MERQELCQVFHVFFFCFPFVWATPARVSDLLNCRNRRKKKRRRRNSFSHLKGNMHKLPAISRAFRVIFGVARAIPFALFTLHPRGLFFVEALWYVYFLSPNKMKAYRRRRRRRRRFMMEKRHSPWKSFFLQDQLSAMENFFGHVICSSTARPVAAYRLSLFLSFDFDGPRRIYNNVAGLVDGLTPIIMEGKYLMRVVLWVNGFSHTKR